jgi:PAS domain S-box-containing protein
VRSEKKIRSFWVIVILSLIVFLIDGLIPTGYAAWLLYFIPLLISSNERPGKIYYITVICTALIVVGTFVPEVSLPDSLQMINRVAGIVALWIVAVDISEKSRFARKLKEAEERLRHALNAAQMVAWEYDPATLKVTFSKNAEKVLDLPRKLENSNQGYNLIHPDDVERHRELVTNAIETGGSYVSIYRHVHGELIIWLEEHGRATINQAGKTTRLVGVVQNITERKQAELALSERTRELNAILSSVQDYVYILDRQGRFVFANKKLLDHWGMSAGQALGKSMHDLQYPAEVINTFMNGIRQVLQTGKTSTSITHYAGSSDTEGIYENILAPVYEKNSTIELVAGSSRDITDRMKAEEALQRRTEELGAVNHDLESFSYSVSHDLRNPLYTIGKFADFLLEDHVDCLDKNGREYLNRINEGVKKMTGLIDNILILFRLGRQEMHLENVDLSFRVQEYLLELMNLEPERKVELNIPEKIQAEADPRLIHLALENLLRNSWKFASGKAVTVIEFGVADQNGPAYYVRDNGIGFDMNNKEKLFQPFMRLHAEKEFEGTGIGLSIVQRVINRHGGKIWAVGEPGKGATFYFTLGKNNKKMLS